MQQLVYELRQLTRHNRDGSFKTQANRLDILTLLGRELIDEGYKQLRAGELRLRHANALVARWQREGLSSGTIRNRLAVLRWACTKLGRASVLPASNARWGLEPRAFVNRTSKAQRLDADKLAQIRNPYVRLSLELQAAFGLRKAESMLMRPWVADQGAVLWLKGSWTKGGRERQIPMLTDQQREVLDRAKAFVGHRDASLIPAHLTSHQHEKVWEREVARAGLSKLHGLRHRYAGDRYRTLTGWACPLDGGPHRRDLSPAQAEVDLDARGLISQEMGHQRLQITAVYLGV